METTPAAPKVTKAPRSGGAKGVLVAFGSLGCLGAIAVGVVLLCVALNAKSRRESDTDAAGAGHAETVERRDSERGFVEAGGDFPLTERTRLDSDTTAMLGALSGEQGRHASGVGVVVLDYLSPDRARESVGMVKSILFPETSGWSEEELATKAGSILRHRAGKRAAIRLRGARVFVLSAEADQSPQFEALASEL